MYSWYKIESITATELSQATLRETEVEGKAICLLKMADKIFAFAATCPHASAKLCDGFLDIRGNVVCPLHGYRFHPANGRNTSGEGYKLRTYPLEIREDFIYIGLII